jgi:hypothetical protein
MNYTIDIILGLLIVGLIIINGRRLWEDKSTLKNVVDLDPDESQIYIKKVETKYEPPISTLAKSIFPVKFQLPDGIHCELYTGKNFTGDVEYITNLGGLIEYGRYSPALGKNVFKFKSARMSPDVYLALWREVGPIKTDSKGVFPYGEYNIRDLAGLYEKQLSYLMWLGVSDNLQDNSTLWLQPMNGRNYMQNQRARIQYCETYFPNTVQCEAYPKIGGDKLDSRAVVDKSAKNMYRLVGTDNADVLSMMFPKENYLGYKSDIGELDIIQKSSTHISERYASWFKIMTKRKNGKIWHYKSVKMVPGFDILLMSIDDIGNHYAYFGGFYNIKSIPTWINNYSTVLKENNILMDSRDHVNKAELYMTFVPHKFTRILDVTMNDTQHYSYSGTVKTDKNTYVDTL